MIVTWVQSFYATPHKRFTWAHIMTFCSVKLFASRFSWVALCGKKNSVASFDCVKRCIYPSAVSSCADPSQWRLKFELLVPKCHRKVLTIAAMIFFTKSRCIFTFRKRHSRMPPLVRKQMNIVLELLVPMTCKCAILKISYIETSCIQTTVSLFTLCSFILVVVVVVVIIFLTFIPIRK